MTRTKQIRTKRGAVSLYVVVFFAVIVGVITLGFIRIVINNSIAAVNADLYLSAYDSAMAGVEDAKIALLKYHDCLSQGEVAGSAASADGTCPKIIYEMEKGIRESSCDVVQKVLGRAQESEREVVVQETQTKEALGNSYELSQAYTCVKITEENNDYRTTLSRADDVRIIPIRTEDLAGVQSIQISWFSQQNRKGNVVNASYMGSNSLSSNNDKYAPPVITVDYYQTDSWNGEPNFTIGQLSANNNNSSGTDHAMLVLKPQNGSGTNSISADNVLNLSDKHDNAPVNVNCNISNDFACTLSMGLPPTFGGSDRAKATSFIRLTLPYTAPDTDVSISLCNDASCGDTRRFVGVQASIDSTGRANDLYRRIESRVELVDLYYPYPEYTVYLNGAGNVLSKSFYVTNECFKADNGIGETCKNSDTINPDVPLGESDLIWDY
ncbi:hypothetical protein IJG79_00755 [Candidatus Saccharibacteria bacterium]|nr:hypothetical protein [Candidatus Saccharibacteria bacterium]